MVEAALSMVLVQFGDPIKQLDFSALTDIVEGKPEDDDGNLYWKKVSVPLSIGSVLFSQLEHFNL